MVSPLTALVSLAFPAVPGFAGQLGTAAEGMRRTSRFLPQNLDDRAQRRAPGKGEKPDSSLVSPSGLMVARSSGSSWLYSTLIVIRWPLCRMQRVVYFATEDGAQSASRVGGKL